MNIEKVKKTAWSIVKDVLLALLVVVIVMGALFAYCQVWPPVVVVESGSMMHGVNSEIGDRKSTRLNSSHIPLSRMPSSA